MWPRRRDSLQHSPDPYILQSSYFMIPKLVGQSRRHFGQNMLNGPDPTCRDNHQLKTPFSVLIRYRDNHSPKKREFLNISKYILNPHLDSLRRRRNDIGDGAIFNFRLAATWKYKNNSCPTRTRHKKEAYLKLGHVQMLGPPLLPTAHRMFGADDGFKLPLLRVDGWLSIFWN